METAGLRDRARRALCDRPHAACWLPAERRCVRMRTMGQREQERKRPKGRRDERDALWRLFKLATCLQVPKRRVTDVSPVCAAPWVRLGMSGTVGGCWRGRCSKLTAPTPDGAEWGKAPALGCNGYITCLEQNRYLLSKLTET